MRRRRRNRSTWFPILGFETATNQFTTVDIREHSVNSNGTHAVTVVPIIQDIDPATVDPSLGGGGSLRDLVEGQTCIIDRVVGKIVVERDATDQSEGLEPGPIVACAALAVIPTEDQDASGNPAIATADLDPLNPANSSNPWLWRRTWILGVEGSSQIGGQGNLPPHNLAGSVAEGSHIDTKGSKRAIRREERIFLIYSFHVAFVGAAASIVNGIRSYADLRVVGRMTKAHNRSSFK